MAKLQQANTVKGKSMWFRIHEGICVGVYSLARTEVEKK